MVDHQASRSEWGRDSFLDHLVNRAGRKGPSERTLAAQPLEEALAQQWAVHGSDAVTDRVAGVRSDPGC